MKHTAKSSNWVKRKSRIKNQASILPFLFFLVLLCWSASAPAAVLPNTAKLVPPETVLLVDIDDFSQLKTQFEKTTLYELYKDPAMAGFVDDFKAKWRQKIRELDNEFAEAIVNADVLPQGRLAAAMVLNKQTKDVNNPPILLISQWGEKIAKIKEAIEKTVKKAVEDGAHQRVEDYRGVTITTITKELPPKQVSDWDNYKPEQEIVPMKTIQPEPVKTSYCFIDDCLIGSMDLDVLKFVIAHIKGASSPTLADDTDYTVTKKIVGPYHDINFYVNIKQIIKTILAEDTTGKTRSAIVNLGIDNVTAFGGSIGLARRPGSSYCGKAFLNIEGSKKGISRMLDIESDVFRAPRFISASAYAVTFLNLDIKKAYEELYRIIYSFSAPRAALMHMPLLPPALDGQPGLYLKPDIIDHLGSQVVIAQSINKPIPDTATSAPTESLVALAVNNRRALEKSLSLWHSKVIAMNNPNATRELLGHTIYLVSLPGFPFLRPGLTPMQQQPTDQSAVPPPTLAFTVTDTHLILGVEPAVERAIRTLSSTEAVSVDSAKWFTTAKLSIPSVVGLACLEDNAASSEFFWKMLKNSAKASDLTATTGPASIKFGSKGIGELVDLSLLPEFDVVRKYFGSSVSYGISRPDGFFFEFKYLK